MSAVAEPVQDDVALWMFFRSLKASKLLPLETIDEIERAYQSQPFENLRTELIDSGLLTKYQIERLINAEAHGLAMGQYRILEELGSGGCGIVYKARHALMDRVVALKVIGANLLKSKHARDIFLREVIASTRLSHPNIATAYDANEHDGSLFFVMEFIEGATLQRFVEERGPLPFTVCCTILLETALALQHAHERGLVHRDIKPANLILRNTQADSNSTDSTAFVKVVDFGLARIREVNSRIMSTIPCQEGGLIGTPAYIAPEQIKDSHAADIRSDLYSLGCVARSISHSPGGHHSKGVTTEATLYQHLEENAEPLTKCRASIPPALARIIHRLMAKQPDQRYQSPNDLISAVNDLILAGDLSESHQPLTATPPPAGTLKELTTSSVVQIDVEPEVVPAAPSSAIERTLVLDQAGLTWNYWSAALLPGSTVSPQEYRVTHERLLLSLEQAARVQPAEVRQPLQQLHSLVKPWVTTTSLASLEPKMLVKLLEDCDRIARSLWPVAEEPPSKMWMLFAIIPVALAAIALLARVLR